MFSIRKKIIVVPCIAVFNRDGKILLLRRSEEKINKGKWEIPGGGIRFGETPKQAALRELWEETGFTPRYSDLIPVDSFGITYKDRVEFIIPLYAVRVDGDPVLSPNEHSDWGWFSLDEVRELEMKSEAMKGTYIMAKSAKEVLEKLGI